MHKGSLMFMKEVIQRIVKNMMGIFTSPFSFLAALDYQTILRHFSLLLIVDSVARG